MSSFEDHLLNGIPRAEACQYFLQIRGRDKVAVDTAAFEAAIQDLSTEERAELLKSASAMIPAIQGPGTLKRANMGGGMPGAGMAAPLPATGNGMNMQPAPPVPLPPTAMGQQSMKMAGEARDPSEVGRERGHASLAAEFEKEKHHSHERNRGLIGHLGGAALGAAVGHGLKGSATSKVLSTLAGSHLGGQAGRYSGQEADRKDWEKKHGEAFKIALDAMGLNDQGRGQQMAQQPAPQGEEQVPARPQQAPQAIEPRISPAVQAFLDAQQAGDQAAEQSQAEFLRAKLDEARAAQQTAEETAATLQEQQAGHEQQQREIQQQVQDSIASASAAQDQVLQEQQASAAMRMAYQQLRGQVLQIASNDPPALSSDAAALSAAGTSASPTGTPEPQAGPAGLAASPGTPNTPGPGGEETVSEPIQSKEPTYGATAEQSSQTGQKETQGDARTPGKESLAHVSPEKFASLANYFQEMAGKYGPALPHAAVGAVMGAAGGLAESRMSNDPLRQKIQALEDNPERGRGDAMNLAQLRARLTLGEHAEKNPGASMASGALAGGMLGLTQGPGLVRGITQLPGAVRDIASNLKGAQP